MGDRCKTSHHSSADTVQPVEKKSLEGFCFGCFSVARHIWAILCNFANNFAMAIVNGRKSEGNGRLPLFTFFPTAMSLGAFYYVCIVV